MAENLRVNPKKFFGELKRRNVYKVAIAYGVVAWLLMRADAGRIEANRVRGRIAEKIGA